MEIPRPILHTKRSLAMSAIKKLLLILPIFAILFSFHNGNAQTQSPNSQSAPTPEELISAVNALRIAKGLRPLTVHPALMQIAQIQVEGIAAGNNGHWRPNNLSLGQWLMSLGYPLSGDIDLDGYRSENWIGGPNMTVQEAILAWGGDDPHKNTMLSPWRSDIGAGIATTVDEWGQTIVYYVLETALRTRDGRMQPEAYPTLTAIALDQLLVYGDPTQAALALGVSQFVIPVTRATARPDGDVIHEVKNGQSLWAIAIEYGVKIDQIRTLNNLPATDIYVGQKLLVQKHATQQPTPTFTLTATPTARFSSTPRPTQTPEPQPTNEPLTAHLKSNLFNISIIAIAILFVVGVIIVNTRKNI